MGALRGRVVNMTQTTLRSIYATAFLQRSVFAAYFSRKPGIEGIVGFVRLEEHAVCRRQKKDGDHASLHNRRMSFSYNEDLRK